MLHIISVLGFIGVRVWVSEVCKMKPQKSRGSEVGIKSTSSSTNHSCPSTDWLLGGGNCYYLSSGRLNWSRSHEDCSSWGSHLAVIQDQGELDFIGAKLKEKLENYAWIGLFNLTPGWHWTWVNGSTLNIQMLIQVAARPLFRGEEEETFSSCSREPGSPEGRLTKAQSYSSSPAGGKLIQADQHPGYLCQKVEEVTIIGLSQADSSGPAGGRFGVPASGGGPTCAAVKDSRIDSEACTDKLHWICQKKAQRA